MKAWFLFGPTLSFDCTSLPKGAASSQSSSCVVSYGRFRMCRTCRQVPQLGSSAYDPADVVCLYVYCRRRELELHSGGGLSWLKGTGYVRRRS